jgi:hypothetical protein
MPNDAWDVVQTENLTIEKSCTVCSYNNAEGVNTK